MHWVISKLNSLQDDVLCIYLNRIGNVNRFCDRYLRSLGERRKAKKLAFIMNVGMVS